MLNLKFCLRCFTGCFCESSSIMIFRKIYEPVKRTFESNNFHFYQSSSYRSRDSKKSHDSYQKKYVIDQTIRIHCISSSSYYTIRSAAYATNKHFRYTKCWLVHRGTARRAFSFMKLNHIKTPLGQILALLRDSW